MQILDRLSKEGVVDGHIVQFYVSQTGLFGLRDCELYYYLVVERKRYEAGWRNEQVRFDDRE